MCLAQGHNAVLPVRLEPQPLNLKSSTLPLSHHAPQKEQLSLPLTQTGPEKELKVSICL